MDWINEEHPRARGAHVAEPGCGRAATGRHRAALVIVENVGLDRRGASYHNQGYLSITALVMAAGAAADDLFVTWPLIVLARQVRRRTTAITS